jgi:hypothetical protein
MMRQVPPQSLRRSPVDMSREQAYRYFEIVLYSSQDHTVEVEGDEVVKNPDYVHAAVALELRYIPVVFRHDPPHTANHSASNRPHRDSRP